MTPQIDGNVDEQTQPIEVRKNACQGHQPTVARIIGRLSGDDPTRQKMGDGSHGNYL